MSGAVNSGHSREEYPKNRPEGSGGSFPWKRPGRDRDEAKNRRQIVGAIPGTRAGARSIFQP